MKTTDLSVNPSLRTDPASWLKLVILLLTSTLALGCQQQDEIVTYTIPTQLPPELRPADERLLAVMVPRGESVWFFKVMGPADAIALIDQPFRDWVSQIQFDESGEPVLDALPEGWRQGGKKPMRFATIDINTPKKQLDLSVSTLSSFGEWDAYVLQNVNRWRDQVSLKPSDDKWAGGEPIEIQSAEGEAVWVDLTGKPGANSMAGGASSGRAPFLDRMRAGGGGMPPMAAGDPVAGGPPAADAAAGTGTEPLKLDFDLPEGWRQGKKTTMRIEAFLVGPEEAEAEVTAIPARGDVRSNVARWMGQVAGQQPGDDAVDAMLAGVDEFDVSGRPAKRFIIAGDQDSDQQSIDATIIPLSNGESLFIKMTGPPKTVAENADSLRTFLDSLSF
ncbi:hypothetical protein NHH03_00400 [Stieleria sp. TO1_6]|uniref:hypothetical protein n=1 Tax=Stieleria tagensis TaxID=2956795 RepID=UPI00209AEE76|nr:hypothetical protein [Stieleria tagensis]MCO8120180.1 hypothetical protein [Stieleria tagensis]